MSARRKGTDMQDASASRPVILRGEGGRFLPGVPAGPGRPKGSINKFPQQFMADAHAVWESHGKAALERLAVEDPARYVAIMAAVVMHAKPRARPIVVEPDDDGAWGV